MRCDVSKMRILLGLSCAAALSLSWVSLADARSPLGMRVAQASEPKKPGTPDEPSKPGAKKKPTKPGKTSGEPGKPGTSEPGKPGTGEPGKPGTGEPGKPGTGEPGKPDTGEPGKGGAGEPGKGGAGEPGKGGAGEPDKPVTDTPTVAKTPVTSKFGVGLHIRAMFIHPWLLGLFFEESTPLNSMGFGAEFVYRRGSFDIIGSIDFGFYSPTDGNYLEKGKNPATEVDYIQFDGLNVLAFSVHFIKHHDILPWMSFVWGGGVGIGIVLGEMFRVSAGEGCDSGTAGDESRCRVRGMDPNNPDPWLNDPANQGTEDQDNPNSPKRWKETDVWPVVPIVHLLVGFDFKISEQFSVRVDGGFRNAFYFGATGHWFF
jgi:hypothetical protein